MFYCFIVLLVQIVITTHKINMMREPFRNLGGIETANRSHTGKRPVSVRIFLLQIFFKILHARSFRWKSGLARSGSERFLPPYPWAGVVLMNRPVPVCSGNLNPPAHGNQHPNISRSGNTETKRNIKCCGRWRKPTNARNIIL